MWCRFSANVCQILLSESSRVGVKLTPSYTPTQIEVPFSSEYESTDLQSVRKLYVDTSTFVFIICQSSTSVEYELVVIKSGRLPFVPFVVLVVVTAIKSFIRTIEDSHLRCCATFRFHFKFCFHFPFSQLLLVRGPLSPPRDKT